MGAHGAGKSTKAFNCTFFHFPESSLEAKASSALRTNVQFTIPFITAQGKGTVPKIAYLDLNLDALIGLLKVA